MSIESLTDEQKHFCGFPNAVFLQACPGSGKTHAIIERVRLLGHDLAPRQGIAVLSYTNAAVDEFRDRVARSDLEHALRYPSFTGTLDAFVRHFIVLPGGIPISANRPTIFDSWDRIGPIRLRRPNQFGGPAPSLDRFDPETNTIDAARIGHSGLRAHIEQHRDAYESAAASRRRGLNRAGYFSADDARMHALRSLRQQGFREALGRSMASRFVEIIVDEAQDCNPLDLKILGWLREYGLRVTVVSDPDQAIYAFRKGSTTELLEFGSSYADGRFRFTGNFRSSPAICGLAATLRTNVESDSALGETKDVRCLVHILAYDGVFATAAIGTHFLRTLNTGERDISATNSIILAHGFRVACNAAGVPIPEDEGAGALFSLAKAIAGYWAPTASPRVRDSALRGIERLLLQLIGVWKDGDQLPRLVMAREHLSERLFRRRAVELTMNIPWPLGDDTDVQKEWVGYVREAVGRLNLVVPQGQSVKRFFASGTKWINCFPQSSAIGVRAATIHSAKGSEYDAVCVVIPADRAGETETADLFRAWNDRTDSEGKRVIYVGVTRARKYLMVAIPVAFVTAFKCIMESAGQDYTIDYLTRPSAKKKKVDNGASYTGSLFGPEHFQ